MMTTVQVPGLLTITIAIVVFFIGAGLNRVIEPVQRWNTPEAVTGGLLAAAATLSRLRLFQGRDQLFSRSARHAPALFLHGHSASTPSSTT
jgi:ESS family glutamate:Na+ symporter